MYLPWGLPTCHPPGTRLLTREHELGVPGVTCGGARKAPGDPRRTLDGSPWTCHKTLRALTARPSTPSWAGNPEVAPWGPTMEVDGQGLM